MKVQQDKVKEKQNASIQIETSTGGTAELVDNRSSTIVQRKLQATMNGAVENPISKKSNKNGLPDNLKTGIENLSGYSMDDVKVHYNSSKPAQLQAYAYAQGTDIYLTAGQEKHLPHEAWHVVQQKQGRVKPTKQLKSKVSINDNVVLEKEADVMGARAAQGLVRSSNNTNKVCQALNAQVIQRKDFVSQNEQYKIKEDNKSVLYANKDEVVPPQPVGLYTKKEDKEGVYWEPNVRFLNKTHATTGGKLLRKERDIADKNDLPFNEFHKEVMAMIQDLPAQSLYIIGKNDCYEFADVLYYLIADQINKKEAKEQEGWNNIDVGTNIKHEYSPRTLKGNDNSIKGHGVTIVAVDGTSKIALQANAGVSSLEKPEFVGFNSYQDWFNYIEVGTDEKTDGLKVKDINGMNDGKGMIDDYRNRSNSNKEAVDWTHRKLDLGKVNMVKSGRGFNFGRKRKQKEPLKKVKPQKNIPKTKEPQKMMSERLLEMLLKEELTVPEILKIIDKMYVKDSHPYIIEKKEDRLE